MLKLNIARDVPDSKCAIRREPEPDITKVASQVYY